MSTKNKLLCILEENRDIYVSGAKLAIALGVGRNAVWKAVRSLRSDGYNIDAVTNRGYCFSHKNDLLSSSSIEQFLPAAHPFFIVVRKSIDSTNTEARARALEGATEGTVVVAEEQTAGRGRRGKAFFSPAQTGLYLSIVLRPTLQADQAHYITTAAAVACAQAIEAVTSKKADIKWVNDIYCEGRKVAGILTEAGLDMESGCFDYAVLGIGINVKPPLDGFPADLADVAGSLCPDRVDPLRSKLAAELLTRFWSLYQHIDDRSFYEEYRRRCFLIGEHLVLMRQGKKLRARAIDLTEDFQLVIELPDKTRETLRYGETSTRSALMTDNTTPQTPPSRKERPRV